MRGFGLLRIRSLRQKLFIPEIETKNRAAIAHGRQTLLTTGKRKYVPVPNFGCGCMQAIQTRTIMTSQSLLNTTDPLIASVEIQEPVNVNILEYIDTIQQTGKAAVLFSDSPLVLSAVDMICVLKDLPGMFFAIKFLDLEERMSWISTVICGTIIIRTFVGLPIAIIQQKAIGRLENLKPELQKLAEELKRETAYAIKKFNWDEKTARTQYKKSFKKHWRRMMEENNCHPMRNLALSIIQLPFWITFSSALRNVVYAVPLPRTTERIDRWIQIHNESTPWVASLVLPDPVILPAIFLGASLLNIEFARRQKLPSVPESKMQKIIPWVMRGVVVAIALISTTVPSAVSMYWATSSSLAFAQNVFLRSETARKLFKLPVISTSSPPKMPPTGKSMEKAL